MRKHGWQLPYHPLQIVAIAVFLALGFAFYVFFLPFVGNKVFQYVVMGIYTPLVTCVFCLYVWCAATNPGDPGVFKTKKFLKVKGHEKGCDIKDSRGDNSASGAHGVATVNKILVDDTEMDAIGKRSSQTIESSKSFLLNLLDWFPLSFLCGWCSPLQPSHELKTSEDGMFYCSICEVEVGKYSKHCRVCDKCVNNFDHHCRWLNNCIGRKNYGRFFVLMLSALLLLILQWSVGVLVLILCFLERKRYSKEIMSKLGSSFSLVPFIVVVASCTLLAMLATLPLAQLFFFHVLLIKKGISTYDYIVALREQEQQAAGQQSPQLSSASSLTGFSSASSFRSFQHGSWCTPPRLFLEDQFDVIPQDINTAANSGGMKKMSDEAKKGSAVNIKINPWALARLNAEEVSKAAALARKKSKILRPIVKQEPVRQEIDVLSDRGHMIPKPDNRRGAGRRGGRLPIELPLEPLAKISASGTDSAGSYLASEASSSLAPLQLEARSAFRPSRTTPGVVLASSPDSSLDSPDLHPFRVSSSGAEDSRGSKSLPPAGAHAAAAAPGHRGVEFSRSTSDGYDASGGEDSDRVPSRIVHRSLNWSSVMLNPDIGGRPMSGHYG